ncbi:hypothetical protein BDQ12DRAFT_595133 [Crucibulum laeve]|uniref:BTB domain-containing protein n=1 Tax=Crucibulum laeve TaxID=68775 RepID=A0A5C3MK04_9AGAR|nr:hypothetical protein BDQ12DRAFT_595133 [Crucibulum laeve]
MGGPYTTSNNPWYYPPYSSRPTYGAPVNNPYVYNPSGPLYNQGYNAPAYNPPLYNGSPYIPPIYGGPIYNPPNPVLSPWATPAPPVFPIGDRFWFADGNVTFDVEGKKYHVHKYFFEQRSSFFRSLLVQYDDTYNEPIVLHGTSSEDFERLLAVFYPKSFLTPDLTTVDEWKSVLKLATEWGLSDIRSLAIEKLAPIASAVDQVVIGHAYDIPSWLAPAYKALVEREVPFTVEEGKMLGIEKLLNIMQAKQELYHMIPKEEMPTWQVERRIRSLFALDGAVLGPAYVPSTNQPTEI